MLTPGWQTAYWRRLDTLMTQFAPVVPALLPRYRIMTQWAAALSVHTVPPVALPNLQLSTEMIAILLWHYPAQQANIRMLDHLLGEFRHVVQRQFGEWAMVSAPFVTALAGAWQGKRVVELMAGNALLSAGLAKQEVAVTATDDLSWQAANGTGRTPWYPVINLDGQSAVKQTMATTDAYLLAWSPDGDPVDWQILQTLRAAHWPGDLLVIGEYKGATNSAVFWQAAHLRTTPLTRTLNRLLPRFDLINERVFLAQ
ncbi:MAG: hypothetical protein LKI92_01440 [Schleiferilactobacillus harbinensis]|jgi:hypothetical protein|nr:hypothetical protein [Schleiferilactobacillus harbinensis]MCI1912277.1 hypothetical protein [Schleiferilactobacillus harbinensis]